MSNQVNIIEWKNWMREFFIESDLKKGEVSTDKLSDNIQFYSMNNEVVKGKENIVETFKSMYVPWEFLEHQVIDIITEQREDTLFIVNQLTVHFVKGDKRESLPCCSILKIKDKKVFDYRAFMDPTPLI